jgi:hypothetical protein
MLSGLLPPILWPEGETLADAMALGLANAVPLERSVFSVFTPPTGPIAGMVGAVGVDMGTGPGVAPEPAAGCFMVLGNLLIVAS